MLYELFMYWVVGSIAVVVASMVLGGVLCVWCASRGSKRSRFVSGNLSSPLGQSLAQPSHQRTNSLQTCFPKTSAEADSCRVSAV